MKATKSTRVRDRFVMGDARREGIRPQPPMGDRRTRRARDRCAANRAAIRDAS